MWKDHAYWNSNIQSQDEMTPLTVTKAIKKTDSWKKSVLDDFERAAVKQIGHNFKFVDYYRMCDGEMSYTELAEVIPELTNMQGLLDNVGIPSFLKHYDLIGMIINVLVGNYMEMQDRFHVTDTGEIAENDYLRARTGKFRAWLQEKINAEIELKMIKKGLDPKKTDFKTEEEKQQYIQELETFVNKNTPDHIENDMRNGWKSSGRKWGEATLEKDKLNFDLQKMEREEFKDSLLTGRYFRHHKIGYDSYKPERWSPINTFFSQTLATEYPQDGSYVGRLDYQSPAEVIKNYGHLIDTKTQRKLLGGKRDWRTFSGHSNSGGMESAIKNNFHQRAIVPHENYLEYNYALELQDYFGIPMGESTIIDKDGTERHGNTFLSQRHGSGVRTAGYGKAANLMRQDLEITSNVCQITEVYFIAYDLVGLLTYEDPTTGKPTQELVTEDLLKDFIKELGIKQIRSTTLEDLKEDYEIDTVKWVYRPVCYKGLRISSPNLEKPLDLFCEEFETQIKGDSNVFDVKLPVTGYIGKSTAKKLEPFQILYNLCLNQAYSLMEKEIGTFFLLDIAFVPSEYKGFGNAEDSLIELRNLAKDIGVLPVATTGDAQKNQTNFNQFATYSITYTEQINSRHASAEYYKQKALGVLGLTEQQLGSPNKYENAEGIKVSQNASYAQTAKLYADFSTANRKTLEIHLAIAQYAQGNDKDLSVKYTKSDSSIAWLELHDPDLPFRRLGLIPSDNNSKKAELEQIKQTIVNNNTIGADVMDLAQLIGSDSYSEVMEFARTARLNKEKSEQAAHARTMEQIGEQAKLEDAKAQKEWEREEITNEKDRINKLRIEQIEASGRAASSDADGEDFKYLAQITDNALKERQITNKENIDTRNQDIKENGQKQDMNFKTEQLRLKAQELVEKRLKRKSDEMIAITNKN